jgi:DNA repair exonuclease SbcCD ATPase subunit
MANQARVTSTDALESFRASLIVFLSKARRSVDDVGDEVRRTRQWLQHDQRVFWESELRRRAKALERAEAELTSARLAAHQQSALANRQMAVNHARQALGEAEDKLRKVKAWNLNFDHSADPIVKRLESLRQLLDQDMPKAIAYLVNVRKTLEAYADMPAPATGTEASAPAPSAETGSQP